MMQEQHPPPPRELEICVETLQACTAAAAGGADRIELCAALAEGGVTPSRGLLREALTAARIPVHVLVRPRTGGFIYTDAEFRAMCHDVQDALTEGAAGVVLGAVTADREIDRPRIAEFVRLAEGRPLTFHRAFDRLNDPEASLEVLIGLGCGRVLTSGGAPTVTEGFDCLSRLARQAAGRIRIAAGGGVTLQNASLLASVPGLDLHASLRGKTQRLPGSVDPLWQQADDDLTVEAVRKLRALVPRL